MRRLVLGALLFALPAFARELYWRDLGVVANLRNDGRLHVVERHTMVFTGDWNGGERSFRVEPYQTLNVVAVSRVDGGQTVALTGGDLGSVDHYQLMPGNVLRWRARNPNDPAFDHTPLTYLIEYSLDDILLPDGANRYVLNHDFAFAKRDGVIEHYTLDLTLADAWESPDGLRIHKEIANLEPGKTFVFRLPLRFHGPNAPKSVGHMTTLGIAMRPWLVIGTLTLAFLLFLLSDWQRNRSLAIDASPIDRAWLERNVLRFPPEVAGLFLYGNVGAPEFAAFLARMEQEGKIRTWVTKKKNLHAKLLVPLESLQGVEHAVMLTLFLASTETDSEKIRRTYEKSGLDLPAKIREATFEAAQPFASITQPDKPFGRGCLVFFIGLALAIYSAIRLGSDIIVIFLLLFGGMFLAILGVPAAQSWAVERKRSALIRIACVPLLAGLMYTIGRALAPNMQAPAADISLLGTIALTIGWLGVDAIILGLARGAASAEARTIRKTLLRAQQWFRGELKKAKPAIDDRWTPWLLALGLDKSIDAWWKVNRDSGTSRAASESRTDFGSTSSSSSSTSTSASAPASLAFGCGSFGGAGATGAWGGAAMALAKPISAPASSSGSGDSSWSSSSSSSSDSSSGGGGGGGW